LGSIQAFMHVARLGSMKAAADTLALSSPALTRRIQTLEQFVGTPLFHRQHKGLQLTLQGTAFLADISPHLDALAIAVDRISEPVKVMRLRIAVPSLFAAQRLMPALPSLHRTVPDLQIDVDTGADGLARLNDGVDAAIAITDKIDDRLYSRLVEKGRVVPLGPKHLGDGEQPIRTPHDLQRHSVLLHRAMPQAFDVWRKRAGVPDLKPRSLNYCDAGQLILDAAAEGLGIAFMFESHLLHSTGERLAQILPNSADSPYSYWFACETAALRRRPVRIFHDWFFQQFPPHKGSLRNVLE